MAKPLWFALAMVACFSNSIGAVEKAPGLFAVHIAETTPGKDLTARQLRNSQEVYYLHPNIELDISDVEKARVKEEKMGIVVELTLNQKGSERLAKCTRDNVGKHVAVLVDDEFISAPLVLEPILGDRVIFPGFTSRKEAEDFARTVNIQTGHKGSKPWWITAIFVVFLLGAGVGGLKIIGETDTWHWTVTAALIAFCATGVYFGASPIVSSVALALVFTGSALLEGYTLRCPHPSCKARLVFVLAPFLGWGVNRYGQRYCRTHWKTEKPERKTCKMCKRQLPLLPKLRGWFEDYPSWYCPEHAGEKRALRNECSRCEKQRPAVFARLSGWGKFQGSWYCREHWQVKKQEGLTCNFCDRRSPVHFAWAKGWKQGMCPICKKMSAVEMMNVMHRQISEIKEKETERVHTAGISLENPQVDLRDQNERSLEQRAQSTLDSENEALATQLVDLIVRQRAVYERDRATADELQKQIQQIGQQICENGGHNRMVLIAYRGAVLGRGKGVRVRNFEFHWDGICGWMY